MATRVITQTEEAPPLQIVPLQVAQQGNPRDVATTLNYYRDPGDGSPPTPVYVGGDTVTNERPTAPTEVVIHDITGSEAKYTLDSHGFQLVKHKSAETTFDDDATLREKYYPECEKLYKKITGASQAHLFGHLVRRGPTHWHSLGAGNAQKKGPLHRVHIDQSYSGAELVLRKNFPDVAEKVLPSGKRWAIVNLWRPVDTIFKDPLAVASAQSIPESDLIEAQVIYTKQPGPYNKNVTWTILPGKGHQWFYKNEQRADEVLFIKCFDSKEGDGHARRAPHCAFVDEERSGDDWGDRESVEIRAVLVWD